MGSDLPLQDGDSELLAGAVADYFEGIASSTERSSDAGAAGFGVAHSWSADAWAGIVEDSHTYPAQAASLDDRTLDELGHEIAEKSPKQASWIAGCCRLMGGRDVALSPLLP